MGRHCRLRLACYYVIGEIPKTRNFLAQEILILGKVNLQMICLKIILV